MHKSDGTEDLAQAANSVCLQSCDCLSVFNSHQGQQKLKTLKTSWHWDGGVTKQQPTISDTRMPLTAPKMKPLKHGGWWSITWGFSRETDEISVDHQGSTCTYRVLPKTKNGR